MNPSGASSSRTSLHPALVEERADRAEDLLEVLARAALVDPHAGRSSLGRCGGRAVAPVAECTSVPRAGKADAGARRARASVRRAPISRGQSAASSPATRASLTISAVFARTDAPSVSVAMRASSHGRQRRARRCRRPSASRDRPSRRPRARRHPGARRRPGPGTQTRIPPPRPRPRWRGRPWSAAAAMSGTVWRRRDARRAGVEPGQRRPARPRRPARRASRGIRAWPGRRGSPSGRRRRRPSACGRAPRGRTRCRRSARDRATRRRRAPRDGRRRSRPSRRPRSRRRAPRSSSPTPSSPPSRRRPAPRRGSAARPSGPTRRGRRERLELRPRRARRAPARHGSRPSPGRRPTSRTAASDAVRDLEVLRVRQAVADQRRFEGDDAAGRRRARPRPRVGWRGGP